MGHQRHIKGGMWQSVKVIYAPKVYVKRLIITPRVSSNRIMAEYWIENEDVAGGEYTLSAVVKSARVGEDQPAILNLGKIHLASGENHGTVEIRLNHPKLWTPNDPHLYYLVMALSSGNKVVTAHGERFGYREFVAKGSNFYLNGKRIYLFGENLPPIWVRRCPLPQARTQRRFTPP